MQRLVRFFLLSWLISWVIWLPLYAPAIGLHGLTVLPFNHALGAYGPMIAAFIVSGNHRGEILKGMLRVGGAIYLLMALLSPFLLAILCMVTDSFLTGTSVGFSGLGHNTEFPYWQPIAFFIYNVVTFGLGEEVGWRGFALPVLQKRFGALTSASLLTIFWALWHIPLFLYRPGYMTMGVSGGIGWFFSLLTGSVLLTWLFNSSRGSILVCAVFHATVDVVFTSRLHADVVNYIGVLITVCGVLVVMVYGPANLSRRARTILGEN